MCELGEGHTIQEGEGVHSWGPDLGSLPWINRWRFYGLFLQYTIKIDCVQNMGSPRAREVIYLETTFGPIIKSEGVGPNSALWYAKTGPARPMLILIQ